MAAAELPVGTVLREHGANLTCRTVLRLLRCYLREWGEFRSTDRLNSTRVTEVRRWMVRADSIAQPCVRNRWVAARFH